MGYYGVNVCYLCNKEFEHKSLHFSFCSEQCQEKWFEENPPEKSPIAAPYIPLIVTKLKWKDDEGSSDKDNKTTSKES